MAIHGKLGSLNHFADARKDYGCHCEARRAVAIHGRLNPVSCLVTYFTQRLSCLCSEPQLPWQSRPHGLLRRLRLLAKTTKCTPGTATDHDCIGPMDSVTCLATLAASAHSLAALAKGLAKTKNCHCEARRAVAIHGRLEPVSCLVTCSTQRPSCLYSVPKMSRHSMASATPWIASSFYSSQ